MKLEDLLKRIDLAKEEIVKLSSAKFTGEVRLDVRVNLSQGGINNLRIKLEKDII